MSSSGSRRMALRDVTNGVPGGYAMQISMDKKYAPAIRKGRIIEEQASRSSFPTRRAAGETHIDLWIDGSLYPPDPATDSPPEFTTTKQYLEFLCHGESGMLGYTKRLKIAGSDSDGNMRWRPIADSLQSIVRSLEERVRGYENETQQLQSQCHQLHVEVRTMSTAEACHIEERQQLESDVKTLESACLELKVLLTQAESTMGAEGLRYHEEVRVLEEKLKNCQADYDRVDKKCRSMVKTPLGYRERVRKRMKSLHELASGSGHAKRRRTMVRAQLQPSIVESVQTSNRLGGSRKRLMGDSCAQGITAAAVASILSQGEANALIDQPRMSQASAGVAKKVLQKIGDSVGPDAMLDACDGAGVTHQGYKAIYRTLKNRIGLIGPGMTASILPAPHRLASLRQDMNAKLPQFIGNYYSIEGRRVIRTAVRQGKKEITAAKEVILHSKNNLFVDLEVVQRSMVLFYNITVEGTLLRQLDFAVHSF